MRGWVSRQVEINAVGPGVHELAQPFRAGRVVALQDFGIDEEALAEILPESGFAFSFRGTAERGQVVHLHAVEVVLALRVDHAEDRIGIGLAVNVGDSPIVANDGDAGAFGFQVGEIVGGLSR